MQFLNEETGINTVIQDSNPYQNNFHGQVLPANEAWIELTDIRAPEEIFKVLQSSWAAARQLYLESKISDAIMPMDPMYLHVNFDIVTNDNHFELKSNYSLLDIEYCPIKLATGNYGYTTFVTVTPKIMKTLLSDIKRSLKAEDFTDINDDVYWTRSLDKTTCPLLFSDRKTSIIFPQAKNNQGYVPSLHHVVEAINNVGVTRRIIHQLLGYKNLTDVTCIMGIFELIEDLSFIVKIRKE